MDGVHTAFLNKPQDVDDDGSGTIGYEEFLKMMTHKILNRDPKDAPWTALEGRDAWNLKLTFFSPENFSSSNHPLSETILVSGVIPVLESEEGWGLPKLRGFLLAQTNINNLF